jgi:hypothetical protein
MRLAFASLVLLCAVAIRPADARAGTLGLRVNEFMAGPARDWDGNATFSSRDDEWIEVRNDGSGPLDLAGYFITDGDSIPRLALSGMLGAGERRVFFGGESWEWERANGHPAFGFSLANGGDAVLLWQVQGVDTVLVESRAYRAHEAAADRSVGRANDDGPWALFDGLNPYTGSTPPPGTACVPTPAALNACSPTPVRTPSWGRLKAIYR